LKPKVLIPEICNALEELLGPSLLLEANENVRHISQTIRLQQQKIKNAANI